MYFDSLSEWSSFVQDERLRKRKRKKERKTVFFMCKNN